MEEIEEEIWRDIPNYEGLYQASNLGRIKSLPKLVNRDYCKDNVGRSFTTKEKILKYRVNPSGYHAVCLCNNNKREYLLNHRLVAAAFLGESSLLVNHKDSNKLNNRLDNLEYVHRRENNNHYILNNKKIESSLIGVCKYENKNKNKTRYYSRIKINGKYIHLGNFNTEEEAHQAYLAAIPENQNKYSTQSAK